MEIYSHQGNALASDILHHVYNSESPVLAKCLLDIFIHLSGITHEEYSQNRKYIQSKADKKLRQTIRRKNIELGIKPEFGQSVDLK